jgi:PAS domain S-box-containing protein
MQGRLSLRGRLLAVIIAALLPLFALAVWMVVRENDLAAELAHEALAVLGATVLAALAAAWWIGDRMIVRPAGQIVGAVRRLEQGQLDARVPVGGSSHRGEFSRIGAAFNLMGESLQRRQSDLEAELGRSRSAYAVLNQVLNSMQEGLVVVTANGRFLMHNEAAAKFFPLHDAPMLPQLWPQHFGFFQADGVTPCRADDLPLVRSALGETGSQEHLLVRNALVPEGRLLQCSWQPIQGGGAARCGLVVFTDVTELHRLQAGQAAQVEQLRQMQRKLIESQRIGRIGNWELDLQTGHLWWSDEVYALFGVAPGAFDGSLQGFEAKVHPEDRPQLKPARDSALRDGEVMNVEYRVRKPDGSTVWMQEIAEAHRDESGEPVWFGGVVQDITRRKRQEQALRDGEREIRQLNASLETRIAERTAQLERQQQLYRALAEQAPAVVWNADRTGRATYFNRAWYEVVGGEPADWLGHGWLSRVHPDDREDIRSNWLRSRASLQPYLGTRRILARNGAYRTMSYKAAPILGDNGQVTSWVGIDSDITELKTIEAALRSSNQELEAFSYSVSHDLRAPLGAIAGFSRALGSQIQARADERTLHYITRIQAGVQKMEQLIESMLSLSKVVRAPLEWGAVDLAAIARETLEGLQVQQPDRRVAADVQDALLAHGDVRLMRVLMENLLGNAWKFTSRERAARIEVGRLGEGAFFVRDNGVGFDMAYASKLFTAFQRLHTEAEFPGTGIGLATVRRIIARHQGAIWAESQVGRGTTFYFSLSDAPPPAWLG